LEKAPGMHRFVWDLSWGGSGDNNDTDQGEGQTPGGPKVIPGNYQVRLTVDGRVWTQPLKVMMDPRSPATTQTLTQQFQLGREIFNESREGRRALAEINSVQKQLADTQKSLGNGNPQLRSSIGEAQSQLAALLSNAAQDAEKQNPGLRDAYSDVSGTLRSVTGGDRAVPSQAITVYRQADTQLKARIAEWGRYKQGPLAELNQKLRQSNVSPIAISEIEEEVEYLMTR